MDGGQETRTHARPLHSWAFIRSFPASRIAVPFCPFVPLFPSLLSLSLSLLSRILFCHSAPSSPLQDVLPAGGRAKSGSTAGGAEINIKKYRERGQLTPCCCSMLIPGQARVFFLLSALSLLLFPSSITPSHKGIIDLGHRPPLCLSEALSLPLHLDILPRGAGRLGLVTHRSTLRYCSGHLLPSGAGILMFSWCKLQLNLKGVCVLVGFVWSTASFGGFLLWWRRWIDPSTGVHRSNRL